MVEAFQDPSEEKWKYATHETRKKLRARRLTDYPITRLADYPITRLPEFNELADYPITRLPEF
jgi:hypothetical protein